MAKNCDDTYGKIEVLARLARAQRPLCLADYDPKLLPCMERERLVSRDEPNFSYQISNRGREILDEMVHNFKCSLWDGIAL